MPHLLHPYKLVMGGDIAPVVQSNFALSANDFTTLSSTSTMPTGGSISRAGNAMLYDSTGKLTYAPNNLLLRSQEFDNTGVWTVNGALAFGSGSVANATTAPDGTVTADLLVENSTPNVSHFISQAVTTTTNSVFSVYAKAYTRNYVAIGANTGEGAIFNLTNGTVSDTTGVFTPSITAVGNGWYRCSITLNANSLTLRIGPHNTGTASSWSFGMPLYNGDGTSGIYIWGAQCEAVTYQTTPSTYVATTTSAYYGPRFDYDPVTLQPKGLLVEGTRTNLATYSDQFDNAAWTTGGMLAFGSGSVANAIVAPDGTTTADKIVENTASATHFLQRNTVINISQSTDYTFSFYAKYGGRRFVKAFIDAANAEFLSTACFDFVNNTVAVANGTASMTSVGNGWYRCVVSGTSRTIISQAYPCFGFATSSSTAYSFETYTGDGVSGVYLWGAQLEAGSFATSYIPTVASSVARAAETFSLTGYANRLVEAYYIDEQTGANYSGNSALSTGTVTISPPTFGWVTSLRAYTNAYAGSISSPSWLSFSRAGGAMYYDSTGTLTWAPENLLLNSATLSTQSVVVTSPTVTTAGQLGSNYILSFKGTGSVAITGTSLVFYTGSSTLAGTGASNRVSACFFAAQGTLTFTVTGAVTEAQLERVTYQTAPSAYIPTTSAAVYGPRYDYDPSTVPATPRGLLIEEQRTNSFTNSDQFDIWGVLNATVGPNVIGAPDGTTSADKLSDNTTNSYHAVRKVVSINTTYNVSIYAKAAERSFITIAAGSTADDYALFNLANGTVALVGATASNATITRVGNGWYRCSVNLPSGGAGFYYFAVAQNGTDAWLQYYVGNGSGIYIWGAQAEVGSFATSYIPTTTASVTRAADVAQLTGSALTTLRASAATAIAQTNGFRAATGAYPRIVGASSGATLFYDASLNKGGTLLNSVLLYAANTMTISSAQRLGYAFSSIGRSISVNGQNAATDTTVLQLSSGTFGLGYDNSVGNEYLNGWVASLALYNTRLPDAILKQKSSVNAPY